MPVTVTLNLALCPSVMKALAPPPTRPRIAVLERAALDPGDGARGAYLCLGTSVLSTAFQGAQDRLKHSPRRNFVNALATRPA